jgi:hypothetical protein
MKILYLQNGMHHKNHHAMTQYKNIKLYTINSPEDLDSIDLTQFDCVYSPATPINASKYPETKFIFGPHFSVFPVEHQMNVIKSSNTTYVHPSEWAAKVWRDNILCKNMRIESLPFGVDTVRFNDEGTLGSQRDSLGSQNKTEIIIYYKDRHPSELHFIVEELNKMSIKFSIFSYKHRYDENTYIDYLKKAKYCIWIGRHESQGFALEEALSCNVPLLVWEVSSMNQEYGQNYDDIPASVIPYWDARCGDFFYKNNEFNETFQRFLSKLDTYKPREFILETLTEEICEKKLIEIIEKM